MHDQRISHVNASDRPLGIIAVCVSFTGGIEQILNPHNIVEPFVEVRITGLPLSYNTQLPIRNLDTHSQLLSVVWKHGRLHVLAGIDGHPASQSGCRNPAPGGFLSAVRGGFSNCLEDGSLRNLTVLPRGC